MLTIGSGARVVGCGVSSGMAVTSALGAKARRCVSLPIWFPLIPDPSDPGAGTIPLSLTIRPACRLPGDYEYPTDSAALLRLLRQQKDLPAHVLQSFEQNLRAPLGARLLGVDLSDSVPTKIGY